LQQCKALSSMLGASVVGRTSSNGQWQQRHTQQRRPVLKKAHHAGSFVHRRIHATSRTRRWQHPSLEAGHMHNNGGEPKCSEAHAFWSGSPAVGCMAHHQQGAYVHCASLHDTHSKKGATHVHQQMAHGCVVLLRAVPHEVCRIVRYHTCCAVLRRAAPAA
jgi:hypothetical protein